MDELAQIVNQALAEAQAGPESRKEDLPGRAKALGALFALFRVNDPELMTVYLTATLTIPLDKLQAAVTILSRSHHWPQLPVLADIWRAARVVAGMHREQYHAGRYLPPPREWPPEGQRHGIQVNELEPLGDVARLGEGLRPALGEGSSDHG